MRHAYTEAALTRVRSDIRKVFVREFPRWYGIGTLANLFIAAYRQPGRPNDDLSWLVRHEFAYRKSRARYIKEMASHDEWFSGTVSGILDWLYDLDLRAPEGRRCATNVFEDALRYAARESWWSVALRKFITPEPVAKLMLELADLEPGQSVYDPCFGFGEILLGAARRLRDTPGLIAVPKFVISGVETDRFAHRVAECRLVMAGFDGISLRLDDALKERDAPGTGFDRILATPPWGKTSAVGTDGASAEDRFLEHVITHLRPEGRAVVALPERTLVDTEPSYLRTKLLSEYRVEGVVALPPGALEPCTSMATHLVVVSHAQPSEGVRFVTIAPAAWEPSPAGASDRDDGTFDGGGRSRFAGGDVATEQLHFGDYRWEAWTSCDVRSADSVSTVVQATPRGL